MSKFIPISNLSKIRNPTESVWNAIFDTEYIEHSLYTETLG